MNIIKLKCDCCGGNIDRKTLKCDFCGCEYIIKDDTVIKVETFTNPIKDLVAVNRVSGQAARTYGDDYNKFIIEKLANDLAHELYDCMQITTDYNPTNDTYDIRANVRAVIPINRGTTNGFYYS